MVEIDEEKYDDLVEKFKREVKRVEPYKKRRPLTEDLNLRVEYKNKLVETYNDIINFFKTDFTSYPLETKIDVQNRIVTHLSKFKECFSILSLNYTFGKSIWDTIDINNITEDDISETPIDSLPKSTSSSKSKEKQSQKKDKHSSSKKRSSNIAKEGATDTLNDNQNDTEKNSQQHGNDTTNHTDSPHSDNHSGSDSGSLTPATSTSSVDTIIGMDQTPKTFMAIAHQTINYKYDGDPLALDSFIDAIELLQTLCKQQNEPIMLKYIMTKLEGKAREAISATPESTEDIINDLKANIKTESSKVIEGRMLALRADKMNLTKFSERAEELAEQFRRSLCVEGFSKPKAKELSIEKTVELCRKNTKSDTVTAILASTKFSEPKEVIAKMVVEINNLKQFRNSQQYTHKNGNQKNGNGRSFNNKFNKNKNSHSNDNRNSNNGRQNGNHGRSNWNGQNNNRNGQSNTRTFTNSNYRRSNEQPVRLISGNETHPGNGGQTTEQSQQN